IHPSSSSLVRSAIEAWGRHAHISFRPETFWFTILTQLSCYINGNGQSCKRLFVSRDEQHGPLDLVGIGWQDAVKSIRQSLQSNYKEPWMSEWISPGFSTSSEDDETTATVLVMGCARDLSIGYEGVFACGIPSITLLGSRSDWQRLQQKVDRLEEFGAEPQDYARRLRPLLSRFVSTFDDANTPETKEFWNQMVQAKAWHCELNPGKGHPIGQYVVSGWILGFFYWNEMGRVSRRFSEGWHGTSRPGLLTYDNVRYGQASIEDIPAGYTRIAFQMRDSNMGHEECLYWLLAGNVAKQIVDGVPYGF
ncbi:hypothetical protein K431DRAFT_189975, partial [Polychaeton citri CBS 116435]